MLVFHLIDVYLIGLISSFYIYMQYYNFSLTIFQPTHTMLIIRSWIFLLQKFENKMKEMWHTEHDGQHQFFVTQSPKFHNPHRIRGNAIKYSTQNQFSKSQHFGMKINNTSAISTPMRSPFKNLQRPNCHVRFKFYFLFAAASIILLQ